MKVGLRVNPIDVLTLLYVHRVNPDSADTHPPPPCIASYYGYLLGNVHFAAGNRIANVGPVKRYGSRMFSLLL